jgi:hypothetical protein
VKLLQKSKLVLAAVAALFVLVGCEYAGGGTMPSATHSGQATFSFLLSCPTGGTLQTGSLTYIDRPAGVMIHGTPSGSPPGPFTQCLANGGFYGVLVGDFSGTYVTLDAKRSTGTFEIDVTAGRSAPGSLSGAHVEIWLYGAITYHNNADVTAGQIQPIPGG